MKVSDDADDNPTLVLPFTLALGVPGRRGTTPCTNEVNGSLGRRLNLMQYSKEKVRNVAPATDSSPKNL